MITIALLCVLFVLLNAIFVAAEFAMIGAPKTAIEYRATHGDRIAARLQTVLESPAQQDRYIATSQLGITAASLALGMYEPQIAAFVEPALAGVPLGGHAMASVIVLAALTFAHVVYGEIIPKNLALQHAERMARLAYWPMRATLVVLYPFVRLLNGVANVALALFGVRRQENMREQTYTPEELQLIVEESEHQGAIRAESGQLLRELFEFGDLTAGEAMQPRVRVVGVPAGAPPGEIRRIVAAHPHARYPVYDGDLDHIVGVVHVKDLLRRLVANQPLAASDAVVAPVVPDSAALDDVLATLERAAAHVAVVVDEHGGTAGLLSLEDLFEEVVGDIDEGAREAAVIAPLADGSVRVPGTLRLDELGQHFDLTLTHEDVDSVSGLVLAELGRPPQPGDRVEFGRLRLEVTSVSGRGVHEVRAWLVD